MVMGRGDVPALTQRTALGQGSSPAQKRPPQVGVGNPQGHSVCGMLTTR